MIHARAPRARTACPTGRFAGTAVETSSLCCVLTAPLGSINPKRMSICSSLFTRALQCAHDPIDTPLDGSTPLGHTNALCSTTTSVAVMSLDRAATLMYPHGGCVAEKLRAACEMPVIVLRLATAHRSHDTE